MALATGRRSDGTTGTLSGSAGLRLAVTPYNVANALTLIRLLAVPPLVLLVHQGWYPAAFWLFVAAAVTDLADGFIAKRFAWCTPVGAVLDPLADKLLVTGSYVVLAHAGAVPVWLAAMVIGRDLLLISGSIFLRLKDAGFSVEPLVAGKACTFLQLLLAGVALGGLAEIADVTTIVDILVALVGLAVIASGIAYGMIAARAGVGWRRPA